MKKIVIIGFVAGILALTACSYHSKQPVDETYYKKTQSVAWPEESTSKPAKTTKATKEKAQYGASQAAERELNWQDPQAVETRELAIPEMPDEKLQCIKTDRNAYTCRRGQYQCGTGCQSDGSNCYRGRCRQEDCDNVAGQKWDLVRLKSQNIYTCEHPTTKVKCAPEDVWKITCRDSSGSVCGRECNANGTQCESGTDTCWAEWQ